MDIVLFILFGICCAVLGGCIHHQWINRDERAHEGWF